MASKTMANSVESNDNATPTNFTLHVLNLPSDLEKDGVTSIFLDYGQVTGVMLIRSRGGPNQAYVSYAKYSDAELAMNELDQKPPLMLNIIFKDKNKKSLHQPPVVDLSGPIPDHRYSNVNLDHLNGIKKAIDLGRGNYTPAFQRPTYTSDDQFLYPVPTDPAIYNPYDSPEPYRDTNLMYTRGTAYVSEDGRRRIAYGRGYTYYDLPEPHYDIASYLQKVCEIREKGLYEYASEETEDETGNCKICSAPTAFRCQKCGVTFYCSKPCQVKDWPKHKLECQTIPPLVKRLSNNIPIENNHTFEGSTKNPTTQRSMQSCSMDDKPQQMQQLSTQMERTLSIQSNQDKISPTKSTKSNESHHLHTERKSADISNTKQGTYNGNYKNNYGAKKPQQPQSQSHKPQQTSPKLQQQNLNRPQQQRQQQSPQAQYKQKNQQDPWRLHQQNNQQRKPGVTSVIVLSDEDIVGFESNPFLPRNKFVEVTITHAEKAEKGCYYVQKITDLEKCDQFHEDLKAAAIGADFVEPEPNVRYIVEHDNGKWCRGTILSVNPNKPSPVIFHDYGVVDLVPIRRVFRDTFDVPFFARRIRLVDSADENLKHLEAKALLSVKAVSVSGDGTITVQARPVNDEIQHAISDEIQVQLPNGYVNETLNSNDLQKKIDNIPSVLQKIKPEEHGIMIVHSEISQYQYNISLIPSASIPDYTKLVEDLGKLCKLQTENNSNYEPKVGDFICGQEAGGEWYRGIVTSIKPVIKFAAIDECRFYVPRQCTRLPAGYEKLINVGVICKILPKSSKLVPGQCYSLNVVNVADDRKSAMITFEGESSSEISGSAVVSKWVPKSEQKGIEWAKLTSGQEVLMLHLATPSLAFVRSCDPEEAERVHKLEQDVAKYALNPQRLTEMPVVGEIVLAFYACDQNYYRAIVTKIENDKILIKYIDYGNDEETKIDTLFKLPASLKEQPAGCSKIKLKGVETNVSLTCEATNYYQSLVADAVHLVCTFEGHPLEDGVILKTSTNESVNEIIKKFLTPTWVKEDIEKDTTVLTIQDLPPLKLGDVGDEIKAIPLFLYINNFTVVLAPNDVNAAEAIQGQLFMKIAEYVKTTKSHYIPRESELCIAKYEDAFYRGMCLDPSVSPTESLIYFFDYGNTERVSHENIRMMPRDFIELGSFGTLCNITPVVPKDKMNARISQRINELLPINELITVKIISVEDDDTPNIDIPSIRVKLMEENLI